MSRIRNVLFLFGVLAILPSNANAEIVYNFGQSGVIGGTNFVAVAGNTITLDIYATQRLRHEPVPGFMFSDTRLSQETTPGDGTAGVGTYLFDAFVFAPGGMMQPSTDVLPNAAFAFAPGFLDDGGSGIQGGMPNVFRASAFATTDFSSIVPVLATNPATSMFNQDTPGTIQENSVLLGTLTLDVGAAAAGVYDIELVSTDSQFLIGNSIVAGPFVTPSTLNGTLTITAVPEPSTWALLGMGTCCIAWRRRKKAAQAAA